MAKKAIRKLIITAIAGTIAVYPATKGAGIDNYTAYAENVIDGLNNTKTIIEEKVQKYIEAEIKKNVEKQMQELPATVMDTFLKESEIEYITEKEVISAASKQAQDGQTIAAYYNHTTKKIYIVLLSQNMTSNVLTHEMVHYMDDMCEGILSDAKEVALEEYNKSLKTKMLLYSAGHYTNKLANVIEDKPQEYFAEAMVVYLKHPEVMKKEMPQTCEVLENLITTFEKVKGE